MVVYSYVLSHSLAPYIFWSPRLLAAVLVAMATLLIGFIARLEFGAKVAFPAMFLVTVMLLLPEVEQFAPNTEMFMLLPLIATLAVYIYSRNCGHKQWSFFAAGFLGTTAFFYKYTALSILAFIFVNWLIEVWRLKTPGLLWRWGAGLFLGASTAAIMVLGYFIIKAGANSFWECTILFNRYYAGSNNFGLAPLWSHLKVFWSSWWILYLVPCAVFLKPPPRLWFWIGIFVAAWMATGNSLYGHYYVLVMPFWAILCAVGIRALALRINEGSPQPSKWINGLITLGVMLLVLRPDVPWLTCSPARFVEVKYAGYPFPEARIAAKRTGELSSENDFVYVAGSEPELLYYAKRFSPTRFVTTYALMIPTPRTQNYQLEAIQDLLTRPPALIVYVTSSASWMRQKSTPTDFFLFLDKFIQGNYERVGGFVLEGTKGHWAEPLTEQELTHASLILFRRTKVAPPP